MDENSLEPSALTSDAIAGAISLLTQNPQLLSTITSLIGAPQPENQSEGVKTSAEPSPDTAPSHDVLSLLSPILSSVQKRSPESQRREALLCALKPYVSSRRAEMIDHVLKYGKFGDILKKLK